MNLQFLIQLLVNGLVVGTLYGVVAMSFVLIYKATQVVNFAQGELLLIGAWVCWALLSKYQVPFWLGMPLTLVFMFIFGIAIQVVILRPMIGEPIISKWAEKNRIAFTTYTDLASRPEVYALLQKEVEAVNATLPPAQRISRFLLLYKELDADDGELTRTRKVRRSVINEKYAGIIDAIYSGKREIPVDTVIRFQDGTTQRIRTTLRVIDLARETPVAEAAE